MKRLKEIESKLAVLEKEREKATGELSKAEKVVRELQAARETAGQGIALAAGGSRAKVRESERIAAEIESRMDGALAGVEAAVHVLEAVEEDIAKLKDEAMRLLVPAATKRMQEFSALIVRQQEASRGTLRAIAALHAGFVGMTPQREVSRRAKDHFLKVASESMKSLYPDTVPAGTIRVEYFKALAGTKAGRWSLVPDQDLTPPLPSDIEILLGDPALPVELERVKDIDLGTLFSSNGKKVEMNFFTISAQLAPEEIESAMRAISAEG